MFSIQSITSAIIGICWIIFVLYWLINAFSVKRTVWKQNTWYRVATVVIFIIAGALLFNHWNSSVILWTYAPVIGIISAIAAILALALLIWARITLGRNWSARVVLKENHELITTGPYAYVRHPIYSGFMLLILATAVNYGQSYGFMAFILFSIVFISRTYQEEKLMMRHFPDQYSEYKKLTKRLIPWVW